MIGMIKLLFNSLAKKVYKIMHNREYRTFLWLVFRLSRYPRFNPCRVTFQGLHLSVPDAASFLSAYKEIFVEEIYAFPFEGDQPVILDLGANIGLSVFFFKKLYPNARIIAFEADPKIFSYLRENMIRNSLADVVLVNKAAWNSETKLQFCSEGADGGRVSSATDGNLIEVDAVDMAQYLEGEKIDVLKIDIEGAEEFVLPACKKYLPNIGRIFVEYHSRVDRTQCLDQMLNILSDAGFRLHVHSILSSPSPFTEIRPVAGFDLQLNIFGWRAE